MSRENGFCLAQESVLTAEEEQGTVQEKQTSMHGDPTIPITADGGIAGP